MSTWPNEMREALGTLAHVRVVATVHLPDDNARRELLQSDVTVHPDALDAPDGALPYARQALEAATRAVDERENK